MNWLSEHYGNIASVFGLVFSLATLVVASLTKTKVDKIRKEMIDQVNRLNALWSAGALEMALAELLAFCDGKNWGFAIDRSRAAIKLLFSLRKSELLDLTAARTILSGIEDLKMIVESLDRKLQRQDTHRLDINKQKIIADLAIYSTNVKDQINRLILGVSNEAR